MSWSACKCKALKETEGVLRAAKTTDRNRRARIAMLNQGFDRDKHTLLEKCGKAEEGFKRRK